MASLLLRIARIAGFCLLAVLALWFSPLLLLDRIGRLGGSYHPPPAKRRPPRRPTDRRPRFQHQRRRQRPSLSRKQFQLDFGRWQRQFQRDRFKRIAKVRDNFYN
jgi:hypothetical protein